MHTDVRSWRPLQMGRNAVASNHPAATAAGIDVLKLGGNAVDAAVAVSLALGVCEPFMSGLGGDGFYHVFDHGSRSYEGVGAAPRQATAARYADGMPETGPLSISPPGSLAGIAAMHAGHGRLPFAELCRPAIALARDGFHVGHTYRRYLAGYGARLKDSPAALATYFRDGAVPPLAARIVNPALAATLEALAADGVDDFYRGALAASMAADLRACGSMIEPEDLAATTAVERQPMRVGYRGYEIVQTPPVSTGFTLLEELALLERFEPSLFRNDPALLTHLLVEIKKLAFLDRERHGGDPAHAALAPERIFRSDHLDALAARIDLQAAANLPISSGAASDTTYFCVADAEGQVVSAIQSLNGPFGSGIMLPETGVVMNNRMVCWHLQPGHPNCLAPGKKVRHTMNAPMILKDGAPWAVLGTPGADNQVQVNFQAIVGLIDLGLDPQQVVEAPRWSSDQLGQDANWPHLGTNKLTLEGDFPEAAIRGLAERGHEIQIVPPLEGPCCLEIIRIMDDGTKLAGSDPRRDGWAAAFG